MLYFLLYKVVDDIRDPGSLLNPAGQVTWLVAANHRGISDYERPGRTGEAGVRKTGIPRICNTLMRITGKSKGYLLVCFREAISRQAQRNRLMAQWPLQIMGLETMTSV